MLRTENFVLVMCFFIWFPQNGACQSNATEILEQIAALQAKISTIIAEAPDQIANIKSNTSATLEAANSTTIELLNGLITDISNLEAQADATGKNISYCVDQTHISLDRLDVLHDLDPCDPTESISDVEFQLTVLVIVEERLANAEGTCTEENPSDPDQFVNCLRIILDGSTTLVAVFGVTLQNVIPNVQWCTNYYSTDSVLQLSNLIWAFDTCAQEIIGSASYI